MKNYLENKIVIAVVGLVAIIILVGAILAMQGKGTFDKYRGLTTQIDVQISDEARALVEQRIAITEASLVTQKDLPRDERNWDLYLQLAFDYQALGNLAKARDTYEEYLDLNPVSFVVWNAHGNVARDMGDIQIAESSYLQAIALGPEEEWFMDYVNLLQDYYAPQRDEEALAMLERAVQTVGQTPALMIKIGQWHFDHNDCRKAIEYYEVAQTLVPDNEAIQEDLTALRATCTP